MAREDVDLGLLSTTEAASALRVSYQTILSWIKSGRIPAVKIGVAYRVPRAQLEKMMERLDTSTLPLGSRFVVRPDGLVNVRAMPPTVTNSATVTACLQTTSGVEVEVQFSGDDLRKLNDAAGKIGKEEPIEKKEADAR